MKKGTFRILLIGAALIGLVWASSTPAEEVKGSGRVVYLITFKEEFELPDGRAAMRFQQKGSVTADDTSSTIHLSTQDCFGTLIFADEGPPRPGYGYCDGIDRDGDLWFIWWKGEKDRDGSTWGFLGGTGKYAGVEGSGTTANESRTPDGRMVISWEGTWTLK